ncbi:MAG: hypothetical protein A49_01600 [Methyloceanibacter sp.]|nr:MAG: hypothetical protein A49_01600 [Methyloceanibacter sp.]
MGGNNMPPQPILRSIVPVKYVLYARKSAESDDEQAHSIDDQVAALTKLAAERNLSVVKVLREAHSAKTPGDRPVFEAMIKQIEAGKASGILCWHLSRLARNPVDGGRIQWLLLQGTIQSIITPEAEHTPSENAVLLSLETGVATQYIVELMKSVRRGLQRKLEEGIRPTLAPIGYLNERYDRTIVPDPERFPLVRKVWDLMLSGQYRPKEILAAAKEWGLTTRPTRKQPSRPPSKGLIYKLLGNKFYAGVIVYGPHEYPGKHQPMVTLEEFERVQHLIAGRNKPVHHHYERAFTGLIACGECGRAITAETKTKWTADHEHAHFYTYYHCSHSDKEKYCAQRHGLREEDLTAQIAAEVNRFVPAPPFDNWAREAADDLTRPLVELLTNADEWFERGNLALRRAVFAAFSEHATLKDGALAVHPRPCFTRLQASTSRFTVDTTKCAACPEIAPGPGKSVSCGHSGGVCSTTFEPFSSSAPPRRPNWRLNYATFMSWRGSRDCWQLEGDDSKVTNPGLRVKARLDQMIAG